MYKVISSSSFANFEEKVNNHMKEGWVLQGGVCVASQYNGLVYYQAMVKHNNGAKVIPMFPDFPEAFFGKKSPIPTPSPSAN